MSDIQNSILFFTYVFIKFSFEIRCRLTYIRASIAARFAERRCLKLNFDMNNIFLPFVFQRELKRYFIETSMDKFKMTKV